MRMLHSAQIDAPVSGPCPGKFAGRVYRNAPCLARLMTFTNFAGVPLPGTTS